jgi:hypothetical protein
MTAIAARVHEGIIVCSERRLRPTLDRLYNNGRRVIVSTAGADVSAVKDTVRSLTAHGVRRWIVLTHTDTVDVSQGCGWAGRVEAEIEAGPDRTVLAGRYINKTEVDRFVRLGYTTRALVEAHNLEVQMASLRALLSGTRGYLERGVTLDTSTIFTDDLLTHVLVITLPSTVKYSSLIGVLNAVGGSSVGPYNTYYSQVSHFEEALSDARLFVGALQVKDVRVLALTQKDEATMVDWKARLAKETFMKGVGLTYVAAHTTADIRRNRATDR